MKAKEMYSLVAVIWGAAGIAGESTICIGISLIYAILTVIVSIK